jgi:hypothetical protein
MSWNAAGTESAVVPPEHRDPAQWTRPPHGLPAAAPFNDTTTIDYERAVFHAHVASFTSRHPTSDRTMLYPLSICFCSTPTPKCMWEVDCTRIRNNSLDRHADVRCAQMYCRWMDNDFHSLVQAPPPFQHNSTFMNIR